MNIDTRSSRPVVDCYLLIRLAFTPALPADFGPDLGLIVPKLFPTFWGEPLRWHKLFGHSFRFEFSSRLPRKPGIWGRGRCRLLTPSREALIKHRGRQLSLSFAY